MTCRDVVSDLEISAQKYPKIVTQEKEKFHGIHIIFFPKLQSFLRSYAIIFHMFRCINQTFHQNKKNSWDKTEEGNVVLDYAISAQKYPKKKNFKESATVFFKTTAFF